MPRVSTYGDAQVGPVRTTQARYRPADNNGGVFGAIAQGLTQTGQVVQDHAQFLAQLQAEQAELEAKDADNALSQSIDDAIENPETGLRSKQGRNAVEAYEPTIKALESRRTEIAGTLKTPLSKRLFEQAAKQRILAAGSVLSRHVAGERDRWMDDTQGSRVGLSVADAGNAYLEPTVADQHIATAVNELASIGKRKGWDEATLAMETLKTVSDARKGIANRLTDANPELGEKYLKTYGEQMLPGDQDSVQDNVRIKRAQIMAEQRRQETEARQAQREESALVSEQARDVLDMIDNGNEVDAKSLGKLASRLDELGKPVLAIRLRTAGEVQAVVTQAKTWRPDQLQTWINAQRAEQKGQPTPTQAAQVQAAEKLLGRMRGRLQSDPLSWAVEAGVAKLPPIDVRDAKSMQGRVRTALGVAERYGIKPTFLTDEETGLLAGQIAKSNPQGKAKIAAGIVNGFGRYGRDVLGSISGADPVFAHAAGLATSTKGGGDTAERIFAGQEALKSKSVSIPSVEAFNTATGIGKALAYTPKTRGALLASARAIYAGEAVAMGLDPKVVDDDVWEKAINRAAGATYRQDGSRVGGIGNYRGVSVVLPSEVAPDEFPDLMGRLNDDDIKAAKPTFSNGKPVDAATIRSGYLFDAGNGRYFVSLDRNGTQFVRGPKGHFVLDMGQLLPRLRGRKPASLSERVSDWLGF